MLRKLSRLAITASPILALSIIGNTSLAEERKEIGSRYEDDAWYDVSEWFDGNDYNPTDEAIGRWDDERFDYRDKQTSDDQDNDNEMVDASEFYGSDYDDGYGRYVDEDRDGNFESYSRYYDSDNDNIYDSHANYRDNDRDGTYEDYEFSELGGKSEHAVRAEQVAQSAQKGLSGKAEKVTGKVTDSKHVKRLGGIALLLQIDTKDDESIWVDLGNSSAQVFKGDTLTAFGPVTKAGDNRVLVATTIETQGQQRAIERTGRKYSGTVQSTRTAKVRGDQRTVAKLKTEDGKMLTVDMGSVERNKKVKEGDKVSVTGVPVKVGDRVILIADQNSL